MIRKINITLLSSHLVSKAKANPLPFHHFYQFSKMKKSKPILNIASINIGKLSPEYDGFVLYENTDTNKTKLISFLFVFCFASGLWTYSNIEDDQIKINYLIIGGFMIIPFLIFQFRTSKTLKRLVLDKLGENIIITRYQMGGFTEQTTKTKVQVLRGISKAFAFGGSVIKGGGMYGFEQRDYWFQSKHIR